MQENWWVNDWWSKTQIWRILSLKSKRSEPLSYPHHSWMSPGLEITSSKHIALFWVLEWVEARWRTEDCNSETDTEFWPPRHSSTLLVIPLKRLSSQKKPAESPILDGKEESTFRRSVSAKPVNKGAAFWRDLPLNSQLRKPKPPQQIPKGKGRNTTTTTTTKLGQHGSTRNPRQQ